MPPVNFLKIYNIIYFVNISLLKVGSIYLVCHNYLSMFSWGLITWLAYNPCHRKISTKMDTKCHLKKHIRQVHMFLLLLIHTCLLYMLSVISRSYVRYATLNRRWAGWHIYIIHMYINREIFEEIKIYCCFNCNDFYGIQFQQICVNCGECMGRYICEICEYAALPLPYNVFAPFHSLRPILYIFL